MAFNWQPPAGGNSADAIYEFLKVMEGPAPGKGDLLTPISVMGNPTIGVGFDLVKGDKDVQRAVLYRMGFKKSDIDQTKAPAAGTPEAIEYAFIKQLRAQMVKGGSIATLNSIMKARSDKAKSDEAYGKYATNQRESFAFIDEKEVRAAYNELLPIYQRKITSKYEFLRADPKFFDSRESMVLLDLVWNGGTGLLGRDLREALEKGDRAEAWFQIRYKSNGGDSRTLGLQKRRIFASEVFGLYDDFKNVDVNEARNALAMLQRHRSHIFEEERIWSSEKDENRRTALQAANQDYDNLRRYVADGAVDDVYGNLELAVTTLVGILNSQFSLGIDRSSISIFSIYASASSGLAAPLNASRDDHHPDLANNVLVDGVANGRLIGGAGDDTLWGGAGSDTLDGGSGNDTYLFASGDGQDTIRDDKDGKGRIKIGGTTLGSSGQLKMVQGEAQTWESDGTRFEFKPGSTADIGTLTITGAALGGAGSITIENFDVNRAKDGRGEGYLGLKLESKGGVAAGARDARIDKRVGWLDDLTTSIKGVLKTFTVYAPSVSDQTQFVNVDINGNFTGGINLGDGYIAYSGSPITLEIPAGEDSVTVALVNTGDPSQSASVQLSATFSDGETTTDKSNTLTVNFEGDGSTEEPPPQEDQTPTEPDRVIKGDLQPVDDHAYDDLGNPITGLPAPDRADDLRGSVGNDSIDAGGGFNVIRAANGGNDTLIAGSGDDTIFAGGGNNVIKPGEGDNQVYAGGGNNKISLGSGKNTIVVESGRNKITGSGGEYRVMAGDGDNTIEYQKADVSLRLGDGDNTIKGGGGGKAGSTKTQQYYITTGKGDNVIEGGNDVGIAILGDGDNEFYSNKKTDLAAAIQTAGQGSATGKYGNVIAAGDGNNTIVGGNGNDVILTGGGANLVFMGPGNDTFMGGYKVSDVLRDWSTSLDGTTVTLHGIDTKAANKYTPDADWNADQYSRIAQTGEAVGTSSDTIFGGAGNSYIFTSNGDNYVDAGPGNSSVFGGGGNDTIFAGDGSGEMWGGGGDDFIDAEDGDHFVTGGEGNNTIFGGAGDATLVAGNSGEDWATSATGNNYVQGGSGKQLILGSGGNDTLVAGSGETTIYGGSGNEYIVGGDGDNQLYSNSGTGGEGGGSTTIVAGDGNTTIYGGHGSDVIYGGDGIDVIYGGAGETEIYAGDGGTEDQATQIVVGSGNTTVYGGAGYLQVTGGSGSYTLMAGDGDATLMGGSGSGKLYGGAGSAVLIGGSGNDTLYSGQGNTTMQGGGGNTVYEIEADAGDVVIWPANPAQALVFGAGIVLSDLSVTGGLDGDGGLTLVIELPQGGSVSVEGGLVGALNMFQFAGTAEVVDLQGLLQGAATYTSSTPGADGDLLFSALAGDVLNGTAAGNDTLVAFGADTTLIGGGGNDTFIVHDRSTVVDAGAGGASTIQTSVSFTASANIQTMQGMGSTDIALTGDDGYDQTLVANSGNDTLKGGLGSDTLVGGVGQDTFILGRATGHSVVQDDASTRGIVRLEEVLTLGGLMAERIGDDLLLKANGGISTMQLKGFFTSGQAWSVMDAVGKVIDPLTLLAVPEERSEAQADQLWSDFSTQLKAAEMQRFRDLGWTQTGDGRWNKQTTVESTTAGIANVWETLTQHIKAYWYPATNYLQPSIDGETRYGGATYVSNGLALEAKNATGSIQRVVSSTNDAVIYADPVSQWSSSQGVAWFKVNWTPTSTYQTTSSTIDLIDSEQISHSPDIFLRHLLTTQTTNNITYANASVLSVTKVAPVIQYESNGLPSHLMGNYIEQALVQTVQQLRLGTGEQTVYANENTMVVGGTGNGTVYNAALAYLFTGNNKIYNTQIVYGGDGSDVIVGGNTLDGGAGNDVLIGGALMSGGRGDDQVYAGVGEATIKVTGSDAGTDLVGGQGDTQAFLSAYYKAMGVNGWTTRYAEEWEARYQAPGKYFAHTGDGAVGYGDEPEMLELFRGWHDQNGASYTLQDLIANNWVTYLEPLPVFLRTPGYPVGDAAAEYYLRAGIPVVDLLANDVQALDAYRTYLPEHKVVFGQGVAPDALNLSWGSASVSVTGDDSVSLHATLDISWGGGDTVRVVMPHFDDAIGSGISVFEFADGTQLTLAQLLARAPAAPTFDPQLETYTLEAGAGEQVLGSNFKEIVFPDSAQAEVRVTREGVDLLLSVDGSADAVRLVGWYEHSYAYPAFTVTFGDGGNWNRDALSQQGLVTDGSAGSQTLVGLAGYANTLIAGPGDTLIGSGSGRDTYVYNAGSGVVDIQDSSHAGTIQFGEGITPEQIALGKDPLLLRVGGEGDAIRISGFDSQNAMAGADVSTFRFADGTVLTLQGLLARGFDVYGTAGDDVLTGTNVNDRIHAGEGNDTLIGGSGNDTLIGSTGVNTYEFSRWGGRDVIDATAKLGVASGIDVVATNEWPGNLQFNMLDGNVLVTIPSTGATLTIRNIDAIARFQWIDGTYAVYEPSGADRARITTYASDGTVIEIARVTYDGAGGATTTRLDADYMVTGTSQQAADLQGNVSTTFFDPAGVRLSTAWVHADGVRGEDSYSADGSSTGYAVALDGSYSEYQDDGEGGRTTWFYDADENLLRYQVVIDGGTGVVTTRRYDADDNFISETRVWGSENGAHGTYTEYADGSFESEGYDPEYEDGGWPGVVAWRSTGDGHSHGVEKQYDESGVLLGWFEFNFGSSNWSSTQFEADGRKTHLFWSNSESNGNETFHSDGSTSGTRWSYLDGSYSSFVNDGAGTTRTEYFDSTGVLLQTSVATNDGLGNISTTYFDADGEKTSVVWSRADGSSGVDAFNPDGSIRSVVTETYDDGSSYTTDTVTQPDGSYHKAWSMSDGSSGYTDYASATGITSGGSSQTGGDYSYTFVNTPNAGGVIGAYGLNETYTYADGSTYALETVTQLDGSSVKSWSSSDGSYGSDSCFADGSSSGTSYVPSGLYGYFDGTVSSAYTDDGNGAYTLKEYDPNGVLLGSFVRTWSAQSQYLEYELLDASGGKLSQSWYDYVSGNWGDVQYGADGSSAGANYSADGSYSQFFDDGQGNIHTLRYDAGGNLVGDEWIHPNAAPEAAAIADQAGTQGSQFIFQLASATFMDPNAGDVLSYRAALADGTPLPAWLAFDAVSRTFSGTPGNSDVGTLSLKVTATDSGGLEASQTFALTIENLNDTPTVVAAALDQEVRVGSAFSYAIDAGAFADVDAGDTLSLTATQADGTALPGWLSFDPATRTFSGTPAGADVGALEVRVIATDVSGLSASDTFMVTVSTNVISGVACMDNLIGTNSDDMILGLEGNDSLSGGAGNDILDGGLGSDTMAGGTGNDTYVVDSATDVVRELAGEGVDTVQSSVSYTLGSNVENLVLTGSAAVNGSGNALDNVLNGNSGANRLNGGVGKDTMLGGAGNDVYVVDDAGDAVVELADEGTDTVQASVDYTLGANVENLTLTGAALNGTGNELNNVITGNAVGNVLSGLGGNDTLRGNAEADTLYGGEGNDRLDGGAGADQLVGGVGNDVYVVDDAGDAVVELADEGTDTVQSAVDYTLGANVENLTLTGAALNGTGNELSNVLTGNALGNVLSGLGGNDTLRGNAEADTLYGGEGNDRLDGGAGADQLVGGVGNDVYVVDDAGDTVVELANEGTDTVQASVDYTLGANVENLTLTGAAVNGTGNELNNVITGNALGNTLSGLGGNDTLRGGAEADVLNGGAGNDRLDGGLGADTYLFGRGDGRDTLVDTDATAGVQDRLLFGSDIAAEQIWLRQSGNNLEISLIGTGDKVTVANWYLGQDHHVEVLKLADGRQLLDSQVQSLVQAMAAFAPPAAGQTTLPDSFAAALSPVIAANWQQENASG